MKSLIALLVSILGKLLVSDLTGWLAHFERWILEIAARRVSKEYRARTQEEWGAMLEDHKGMPFTRLVIAIGFLFASRKLSCAETSATTPVVDLFDIAAWREASVPEQAFAWLFALELRTADQQEQFAAWIRESPMHVREVQFAISTMTIMHEVYFHNPMAFGFTGEVAREGEVTRKTGVRHLAAQRETLVLTTTYLFEQWKNESVADNKCALAVSVTLAAQAAIGAVLNEWAYRTAPWACLGLNTWLADGKTDRSSAPINEKPIATITPLVHPKDGLSPKAPEAPLDARIEVWLADNGPEVALEVVRACERAFVPDDTARSHE